MNNSQSEHSTASSSSSGSVSSLPLPFSDLQFPSPRSLKQRESDYVDSRLRSNPDDYVVAVLGTQTICIRDLKRLCSVEWLGDPIINGYLSLAVTRMREQRLNVQAVNSDFSVMLHRGRAYVHDLNPFDYDRVAIPMHTGDHWFGVCLDMSKRKMMIGDSLGRSYNKEIGVLYQWICDMEVRFSTAERQRPPWRVEYCAVPQQNNGYDCGVYTLLYCVASLLGLDAANLWIPDDVANYRRLIALDIIRMGAVKTQIVDTAPSLSYALRIELELTPNQSARQLVHALRVSRRYELSGTKSDMAYVRGTLAEMLRNSEVARRPPFEGATRGMLYYVPGYSAEVERCTASKIRTRQQYPPPLERREFTIAEALVSLLHRYGILSADELCNHINLEAYCRREVERTSVLAILNRLHKEGRVRRGRDRRYRRVAGVLPRSWVDDTLRFATLRYADYNGLPHVWVDNSDTRTFLRTGMSRVHGRGVFAKRYIGTNTLFELAGAFEPCEADAFRFHIGEREFNATPRSDKDVTSFFNDIGPEMSQAELVEIDGQPYVRLRKAVAAGTEVFCAYNAVSPAHWKQSYPDDWKSPFDYTSENGKLKRRAAQDCPAKRVCIDLDAERGVFELPVN